MISNIKGLPDKSGARIAAKNTSAAILFLFTAKLLASDWEL
jgi:hypothetical protein